MKLRTIITAFAASVAVAAPAAAEEQVYYCSSELGTGIYKDEQTGRWRTGTFENIRFTMKFGENTKGSRGSYNRDLILSRNSKKEYFICYDLSDGFYNCVQVLSSTNSALFFAPYYSPDVSTSFQTDVLITDLKRFELYLGSNLGFVSDHRYNSSMYAGTCETF